MFMRKKYEEKKYFFLASLKSMKKLVGSEVGSGSISQRYGSGNPDPDLDPHQNVTDPHHWLMVPYIQPGYQSSSNSGYFFTGQ